MYTSLTELVKLRVSQINGCAFCVDMHAKDARKLGEALWPEGYPLEELEDRKRVLNGPYDWASQYQQRPAPAE